MSPRTWPAQAAWWAKEYHRRALHWWVSRLSVTSRTIVVNALELTDAPPELGFTWPRVYPADIVLSSEVVAPPAALDIPASASYARAEGFRWGEVRVYHFRDVVVDGITGLVFHDGAVLAASGHGWRSARDGAFLSGAFARASMPGLARDTRGPIAPMGRGHNYFHFLVECLPRLLSIARIEPSAVPVFPTPIPAFMRGVLDDLAISFEADDSGQAIRSDDVWLCEPVQSEWPHPANLALLRQEVFERLGPLVGDYPERVYITRAGYDRALRDESLLEQEMRDRGFTVLRPQDLAFREQVAHMRAARVVVAGHGAAQANMAFMQPGGRMVELTAMKWWYPPYRHMAPLLGLDYDLVVLPSTDADPHGRAEDAIAQISQVL